MKPHTASLAYLSRSSYWRKGQGIALTAAGLALLEPARRVREALNETAEAIVRRRRLQEGTLRLAATPTLAHYFLPSLLAAFQAQHQGVRVHLKGGISDWRQVAVGDWDLFFLRGRF